MTMMSSSAAMCSSAHLSTPVTALNGCRRITFLGKRSTVITDGCRSRRAAPTLMARRASMPRCSLHHVQELLPPQRPSSAQLVATVAAKPAASAPPPPPPVNGGFVAFCRAYWPLFVVAQSLALIGAAYSGVSSRRKRVELGKLNEKLRKMMAGFGWTGREMWEKMKGRE